MSTSLLYHTQGLRDYNFKSYDYIGKTVRVTVEQKPPKLQCTICGSRNFTAVFIKEREIKGVPIGTKFTVFVVRIRRLRCHDCGSDRQEAITCVPARKVRYTKTLARSVIELRPKMCIKDVAEFFDLHWNTVKDIEKNHLKIKYKKIRLRDVEVIGIDELHTGDGYITIVRDLESGAVLHIGDGKGGDALDGFAKRLKHSTCQIRAAAVDLAPAYTAWVKENLPDTKIVYDHFHLIKLMNDKIDAVRRKTMRDADEEMKEKLKNKRYLFLKNQENLDDDSKADLSNLKDIFDDLGTATFMKECLRNIYSLAPDAFMAEFAFNYWCKLADETKISCLITMAKTIRSHLDGILAYWSESKLTSAGMEGFNNKVRWLIRQAYGYRDDEYFRLKIFDLPEVKIAKEL